MLVIKTGKESYHRARTVGGRSCTSLSYTVIRVHETTERYKKPRRRQHVLCNVDVIRYEVPKFPKRSVWWAGGRHD
jgi:hypothetical protein